MIASVEDLLSPFFLSGRGSYDPLPANYREREGCGLSRGHRQIVSKGARDAHKLRVVIT